MTTRQKSRAATALRWCGPLLLSAVTAYGAVQYTHGSEAHRLTTVERDVQEVREAQEKLVTRSEFSLIRDDLKEIKQDVRDLNKSLKK